MSQCHIYRRMTREAVQETPSQSVRLHKTFFLQNFEPSISEQCILVWLTIRCRANWHCFEQFDLCTGVKKQQKRLLQFRPNAEDCIIPSQDCQPPIPSHHMVVVIILRTQNTARTLQYSLPSPKWMNFQAKNIIFLKICNIFCQNKTPSKAIWKIS